MNRSEDVNYSNFAGLTANVLLCKEQDSNYFVIL